MRLALGTDSLASTPDLSLWGEIAALARAFPDLAPELWIHAATDGGAQALGGPGHGALRPGTAPGVVEIEPASWDGTLAGLVVDPAPRVAWHARAGSVGGPRPAPAPGGPS